MRASAGRGCPQTLFCLVAAGTFGLDQLAKAAARARLEAGSSVPVLGKWLQLTLTHNAGSAFGLVSGRWWLVAVGVLVCGAILIYMLARGSRAASHGQVLPLGLVLGGSLGNLADRLRTGGVFDFVDLRVWPVFNVADMAITVGVVVLAVGVMRRR